MQSLPIKAIIGLGNPGKKYEFTRHNSGFLIVQALADRHAGTWHTKELMECCEIKVHDAPLILIKPLTFMNSSGKVMPFLIKKGITPQEILVVHDELELPFGQMKLKQGGSAKGHNGLKSIIAAIGPDFYRLRFGIGRPDDRAHVPDYVLLPFDTDKETVQKDINKAVDVIDQCLS